MLPDFIRAFPALDLPFPEEAISTNVMKTDDGLAVFFTAHQELAIPAHSHGPQWGTVLQGELILTMNGETKSYGPGESYSIGQDVEHAATVRAGSVVFDVFAENDRYPLKSR